MNRVPRLGALLLILLLGWARGARAQFGQNHVVIKDFHWKIRSTEHFDIYYYDDTEPLVSEAAQTLERAFTRVSGMLDVSVVTSTSGITSRRGGLPKWERRPFFLYASPNDFIQSNIVQTGFGTGGVTEPLKDRFLVYNDGTHGWLEEVITHEFTHIMQYYVLVSGFWKSARVLKTIIYPLWMMEGMPGWVTKDIEGDLEEYTIRDAATSGGLISLVKLEHFGHLKPHQVTLAYKQGAEAMEFLNDQYGPKKIGEMLRLFESKVEVSTVLTQLIGLDIFQFDKKYREYLEDKYRRFVRVSDLREPETFGSRVTKSDDLPQFNSSPVFTADGKTMFFMSTRHGQGNPELDEQDLASGKVRRLAVAGNAGLDFISFGNFANISRVLSLSSDQRYLAFAGTKNYRDLIYLYDRQSARVEKIELPGFNMINQPQFSPDGRKIVFSGMINSFTDLFLYDRESGRLDRLTEDPQDDAMPAWTPSGDAIIYSSEYVDPLDPYNWGRRLYRMNLSDRRVEQLEDLPGSARDPVVSPDGSKVLFVLKFNGLSEVCEMDLSTREIRRLTRSIGASFTPVYVGDEIAFAALRHGDIHIFKGKRDRFLGEKMTAEPPTLAAQDKFFLPGMGSVAPSTAAAALGPSRPYHFTASTDLFLPALFFSSPGGLFLTGYWQGSDMLGNHAAATTVAYGSQNSVFSYQAQYAYARYRPQLFAGAQGFGERELYDGHTGLTYNQGQHAQFAGATYPLDQFHRVDMTVESVSDKITFTGPTPRRDFETRLVSWDFVRDTATGRYLTPNRGNRFRVVYSQAVDAAGGNQRYSNTEVEAHQFFPLGSAAALALRADGVQSYGRDSQGFIMGGEGGVRGYPRSTDRNFGNRVVVSNAELRFPIFSDINYYMWYFFPDFYFKALFGSIFTDAGYAWNFQSDAANVHWNSLRNSVGVGLQLWTFILQEYAFVVSMDYARPTTAKTAGILYVYLGTSF